MTLISDLLHKGPTFSFEFFPPKNDTEQVTLVRTLSATWSPCRRLSCL